MFLKHLTKMGLLSGAILFVTIFLKTFNISASSDKVKSPSALLDQYYTSVLQLPVNSGTHTKEFLELLTLKIQNAFYDPHSKEVVLLINSGGCSSDYAEHIYSVINKLRKETGKKVFVFSRDVNGSGAYFISLAADAIVMQNNLGRVGSLGALCISQNLHGFLNNLGIKPVVLRSGNLKAEFLDLIYSNPDGPEFKVAVTSIKSQLSEAANRFVDLVIRKRGSKIQISREEMLTGKDWSATDSIKNGLIDGIMSPSEFAKKYCNGRLFVEKVLLPNNKAIRLVYTSFAVNPGLVIKAIRSDSRGIFVLIDELAVVSKAQKQISAPSSSTQRAWNISNLKSHLISLYLSGNYSMEEILHLIQQNISQV